MGKEASESMIERREKKGEEERGRAMRCVKSFQKERKSADFRDCERRKKNKKEKHAEAYLRKEGEKKNRRLANQIRLKQGREYEFQEGREGKGEGTYINDQHKNKRRRSIHYRKEGEGGREEKRGRTRLNPCERGG